MRHTRCLLRVILSIGLLVAVMVGAHLRQTPGALAQEDEQCEQLAAQALSEARVFCDGLARGEACYGYKTVTASLLAGAQGQLAAGGDRTAVADLEALTTSLVSPETGEWGLAVLKLAADLPEESGLAVTAALFGDAQIARPAVNQTERPTLTVYNRGSAPANLRNGAAITYDVVGQLAPGEEALADGRNEQGDWVRIQYAGGIAWVFTPLIGWEGDQSALDALDVLLPNDVTPPFQAGEPFQAFTLVTGAAPCNAAPSGMLLQYAGQQPANLQVNQVNLAFSDATLHLTARPADAFEIRVLAGSVMVTARGVPLEADAGAAVRVVLGGEDGLTPTAAPTLARSYAFADVTYVPLDLLPVQIACTVGLPAPRADVWLRVGPGEQRGKLGVMNANAAYAVLGWANDPDGAPWWELDTGTQTSWVRQADVRAVGACAAVAQVEPPPMVLAPPVAPPAGEGGAAPGGDDLAPATSTVWQMKPGTDNMVGECSGAPAINFCDHLAAISPAAGGISWKGMEASPYYLVRIQPNVYSYAGPNILGTGRLSMTLTFTSATTLNMTMSLVLNSEPNCQHIYYYTGTRNW